MIQFTPRPGAPEPGEESEIAWLRETLDGLAAARGVPPGWSWQIRAGVREAGGSGGPRLRQTGYQIAALDGDGRAHPLTCFVGAEDAGEEELRPAMEQVLGLWLDRVSEPGPA